MGYVYIYIWYTHPHPSIGVPSSNLVAVVPSGLSSSGTYAEADAAEATQQMLLAVGYLHAHHVPLPPLPSLYFSYIFGDVCRNSVFGGFLTWEKRFQQIYKWFFLFGGRTSKLWKLFVFWRKVGGEWSIWKIILKLEIQTSLQVKSFKLLESSWPHQLHQNSSMSFVSSTQIYTPTNNTHQDETSEKWQP